MTYCLAAPPSSPYPLLEMAALGSSHYPERPCCRHPPVYRDIAVPVAVRQVERRPPPPPATASQAEHLEWLPAKNTAIADSTQPDARPAVPCHTHHNTGQVERFQFPQAATTFVVEQWYSIGPWIVKSLLPVRGRDIVLFQMEFDELRDAMRYIEIFGK